MKPAHEVSPELRRVLKRLCLGKIIDTLPERLMLAQQQKMSFEDILLIVLGDEISRRDSTPATRRAQRAGLDRDMVVERWDAAAKVQYDRRVFNELCSLRFIEAHRNVVVMGPV